HPPGAGREMAREPLENWNWASRLLYTFANLHISAGNPQRALTEVNRWVAKGEGGRPGSVYGPFLCIRAILEAAVGSWNDTERDVADYLDGPHDNEVTDAFIIRGHLLKGFLRMQRRDESGAIAAWRNGFRQLRSVYDPLDIYYVMLGRSAASSRPR